MKRLMFWTVLIATASLGLPLDAAPIVYDPFDYAASPDTPGYYNMGEDVASTHNAGVGLTGSWSGLGNWTANWTGSGQWKVAATGLTYQKDGVELQTAGGALDRQGNSNSFAYRPFAGADITTGTLYSSFLIGGSGWSLGLGLAGMSTGVSTTTGVGIVMDSSHRVTPTFFGVSDPDTPGLVVDSGTHLLVFKIDLDADRMVVWLDPGLGKTEAQVDADADYLSRWTIDNPGALGLGRLGIRTRPNIVFDEFRLAQVSPGFDSMAAWNAVTPTVQDTAAPIPEPASAMLLTAGLIGLAWRKHKR